jgi:hypothetical protein
VRSPSARALMVENDGLPSLENHGIRPQVISTSSRPPPSFAWRTTGSAVVGAALYHAGQFGSSP